MVAVAASALGVLFAAVGTAPLQDAGMVASSGEVGIWSDSVVPKVPAAADGSSVTLGVQFSAATDGYINGIQFYRSSRNVGPHVGKLWTSTGTLVQKVTFPTTTRAGWTTARFATPVKVNKTTKYVASYTARRGRYAADANTLSVARPIVTGGLTAWRGVYNYSGAFPSQTYRNSNYFVDILFTATAASPQVPSTTPSTATATAVSTPSAAPTTTAPRPPTPTVSPAPTAPSSTPTVAPTATPPAVPTTTATASPPASGAFPDGNNTGVPSGVTLSAYSGPLTVTTTKTAINGKRITGDLVIRASGVTVTNTVIDGRLLSDTSGASVTVEDSEINGGNQETVPAVSYRNVTLRRVEVTGGQHSVQCSSNCVIEDSWLHNQYLPANSAGHVNAFISNGGSGFTLRHNTLHCTVQPSSVDGGCTADLSLFGDFGPISNVTIDHNLFKANSTGASYCMHAGYNPTKPFGSNPTYIAVTNNVFERGTNNRCGIYGPVTSFLSSGTGNTWTTNTWSDGASVAAQ